jgi:hypothetical protein
MSARAGQEEKADSHGVGLSLCLVEALDQLWTKTPAFCGHESALDSARATESTRFMVGAVGIELKPTLKIRKLLILLNEKNGKNTEFTQVRYTPGTRNQSEQPSKRILVDLIDRSLVKPELQRLVDGDYRDRVRELSHVIGRLFLVPLEFYKQQELTTRFLEKPAQKVC